MTSPDINTALSFVCVEVVDEVNQTLLAADEVVHIVQTVLIGEGVPLPCEVSVSFIDEQRMHELNRSWRGIDAPTDVLSFNIDDLDDFEVDEDGIASCDDESLGDVVCMVGDVILCPAVVAAQAQGFGNSIPDEARLLLVHGCLHLMGYDHEDEAEAEEMEALERKYLAEFADADASLINVGPTVRHKAEGSAVSL